MNFLGHLISSDGIKVYPQKFKAVKKYTRPMTPTTIRSFLVLAGYYRMFLKSSLSIAAPLMNFLWRVYLSIDASLMKLT